MSSGSKASRKLDESLNPADTPAITTVSRRYHTSRCSAAPGFTPAPSSNSKRNPFPLRAFTSLGIESVRVSVAGEFSPLRCVNEGGFGEHCPRRTIASCPTGKTAEGSSRIDASLTPSTREPTQSLQTVGHNGSRGELAKVLLIYCR